jgi:hypothetical protein
MNYADIVKPEEMRDARLWLESMFGASPAVGKTDGRFVVIGHRRRTHHHWRRA